jgi:hypothetical protein
MEKNINLTSLVDTYKACFLRKRYMTKSFAAISLLLFFNNFLSGQTSDASSSIDVHVPFFVNFQVNNIGKIEGSPSYHSKSSYAFGINYMYSTCTCSAYELGIEFSNYSVTVLTAPTGQLQESHDEKISLISVPLELRLNFLKYFFVNGGFMIDIDVSKSGSISNQSGFGAIGGLGINYNFKSGIGLYLNPYYKIHSWVSFASSHNAQRLSESAVKFGLTYRFKQKS